MKQKEEQRRAAVEEKRKQKIEEEKVTHIKVPQFKRTTWFSITML